MIDRLVHHAEVIALKGDSYRLKDRDLGRVAAIAESALPCPVNLASARRVLHLTQAAANPFRSKDEQRR
jgi:hypothetical protein